MEIFIPVGQEKQVTFESGNYRELNEKLKGILRTPVGGGHLGIQLILKGSIRTELSNLEVYRMNKFPEGECFGIRGWRTIRPENLNARFGKVLTSEFVYCPKCKSPQTIDLASDLGITLPPNDCQSAFETARTMIIEAMRNIERSCPNHTIGQPYNVVRDTLNV